MRNWATSPPSKLTGGNKSPQTFLVINMHRPITAFKRGEHGQWLAFLSCGHKQHVRHQPPFFDRPWVTTEQGRSEKINEPLDCVECDRFEIPDDFEAYRKTVEFNEQTIPQSLRRNHSTKPGVWAKIHVIEGKLIYRVGALDASFQLSLDTPGVVIPEIGHHVEPIGPVRFFVEFYKRRGNGGT
jgi:tellurite methyltransferase